MCKEGEREADRAVRELDFYNDPEKEEQIPASPQQKERKKSILTLTNHEIHLFGLK